MTRPMLGISTAPASEATALSRPDHRPRLRPTTTAANIANAVQLRIDVAKGAADFLGEGEIGVPIAAVEIVVEDAADAAHLLAVLQVEILVAPRLEFLVRRDAGVGVAGGTHGGVERLCVGIVLG